MNCSDGLKTQIAQYAIGGYTNYSIEINQSGKLLNAHENYMFKLKK